MKYVYQSSNLRRQDIIKNTYVFSKN